MRKAKKCKLFFAFPSDSIIGVKVSEAYLEVFKTSRNENSGRALLLLSHYLSIFLKLFVNLDFLLTNQCTVGVVGQCCKFVFAWIDKYGSQIAESFCQSVGHIFAIRDGSSE